MGESKESWRTKKILLVCLLKTIKDNVEPAHWVGHSQKRSLDTDDFFKRTSAVDEKQANVTVNTMKQSVFGEQKNPVLLQEEE